MSRLCVDTSAYSHFKSGHPAAVEAIASARSLVVPVVVLGELQSGFLMGSQRERNLKELRAFMTSPVVTVGDIDAEAASTYAEIVRDLRRAGTPLPTNDVWIAAVALREGATVITFDRDFARIRRVGAVVLQAGLD